MITPGVIANILYKIAKDLCPTYKKGNIPEGKVEEERIVIIPKTQTSEVIWKKCFVEINYCVPDIERKADNKRLTEVEGILCNSFDGICGSYDGLTYQFEINSLSQEEDKELNCHYVNCRILFNVLNVK